MWRRLFAAFTLAALSVLLVLSWATSAFAQSSGDGDGLDGDELGLPIVFGIALLAGVAWITLRSRSRRSS
jgi:hypothetical protein